MGSKKRKWWRSSSAMRTAEGRSRLDLVATLRELTELGVGFVSLSEALDLTTPASRAMAGMPAVFVEIEREVLRERGSPSLGRRAVPMTARDRRR